jgi:hypothetical protein
MGIDLIPYVDARGRPPDRSDELISLHRPQIFKGFESDAGCPFLVNSWLPTS